MRGMIALGIERGREREDLGRTEFDAESAALAPLDDDRYRASCQWPLLGVVLARRGPIGYSGYNN